MDLLVTILLSLPSAWWLYSLTTATQAARRMPSMADLGGAEAPSGTVSAIVPIRDEGPRLRDTLLSLAQQDGVALEVVAVDDRSTDETGAIIDELAREHPDVVTAVHVTELPDGWLGKLHALQRGSERARGDWLLIADADTRYAPGALASLVALAEHRRLDALSAVPRLESGGLLVDAVFSAIGPTFNPAIPLWRVEEPDSDAAAASGAFILVRAETFARTPGFEWLRLEVADDWGLMLLVKEHGGRCAVVNGTDQLSLRWYASFREMLRLMQKNCFAVMGRFSLLRSLVVGLALAFLGLAPWLALAGPTLASVVAGATGIAAMTTSAWIYGSWGRRPLASRLWPTVGLLALAVVIIRAGVVGWRVGGIDWRGTYYPSALLRGVQKVKM